MAVNCSMLPAGIVGMVGVTAINTNVAEVTVRVVLPEMLPLVAVRVALPARVNTAGWAAARVPALLVAGIAAAAGQTTTPNIVHGAPKFLCRPIGFHANR